MLPRARNKNLVIQEIGDELSQRPLDASAGAPRVAPITGPKFLGIRFAMLPRLNYTSG